MAEVAEAGAPPRSARLRDARLRLSAAFWRRPWLKLGLLLAAPVAAFALVYLGALTSLFVSSFWEVDSFTGKIVHTWTLSNFSTLIHEKVYRDIALRTIWMAAAVTLTDIVLAFPLAYFMARAAAPGCAFRDGAAAPVVELPRPDLRLADDPRERRCAELGLERTRPARCRARIHEHRDVDRLLVRL